METIGALDVLEQSGDDELLEMIRSELPGSPRRAAACEVLVARYRTLVRSCANRYRRSPESAEDLIQVGYVGLLKAINNFDPGVGRSLAAYAQPCITGEIKRYFRDKRWQVHVERPVQERLLELREGMRQLTQQLGRGPSDAELAEHCGFTEAEVREAPAGRPRCSSRPRWTRRWRASPRRPASPTCSARRTRGWSTPCPWRRWPCTGASCPGGSSASC